MFIEQRQVGQMAVFAYLVGDQESSEALVIDPAEETDALIEAAEKNKVKIRYIVNTHGHVDHTGGNVDMKEKTGAAIIIHEDDADMLVSTPAAMLRMFGAKQSPPADRTVRDGDFIDIGSIRLQVIHTPGHSP
ncbi:MAG: MBL fold metallo-hydrolase, partial [Syntrophales bacterium]